ncbi:MAG TPA: nitrite reductase (NAD(P)H) small subunit [Ignavibacteriales bacterium]|nr:nitrite reductase (NAD(P)H) small subunit [Ignavibacteriales bacterium]
MTDTEGFTKLCRLSELKENEGKKFIIDEAEIALIKTEGEVFALDNICPHQHAAIIYDGFVEEGCIVCPAHGWMFDLRTGCMKTGSRGLKSYNVKVIDNYVYVKAEGRSLKF